MHEADVELFLLYKKKKITKPAVKSKGPTVEEEKPAWKTGRRKKGRARRDSTEVEEEEKKEESILQSQPSQTFVETQITQPPQSQSVKHPLTNIWGEPVEPKEEPMEFDWGDLQLSNLNFPIYKEKKKREPKKKPILPNLQVKIQPKPMPNKDDMMYISDIKEYSALDLYLDELKEVRGIGGTQWLPERLVVCYGGCREITWPLHRILEESHNVLVKVSLQ